MLTVDAHGQVQDRSRAELGQLFEPGDLVVANDAATIPASLTGQHSRTLSPIEIRLAGFVDPDDATRFVAVAFGEGDFRTKTEHRLLPPPMKVGDRINLGPIQATVEEVLDHPRLLVVRFDGVASEVMANVARHGRPIQYAYVTDPLALWDVWTNVASRPFAFETPSAGLALDWRTINTWHSRGIGFTTITHAAGISSTGDPELDRRLPLDEPYVITVSTARAIEATKLAGAKVIAIGTTVVRALEDAVGSDGTIRGGARVARDLIGPETDLAVVDTLLTGMHAPGDSHFELLKAFAGDRLLTRVHDLAAGLGFLSHEFGDSLVLERSSLRPVAS